MSFKRIVVPTAFETGEQLTKNLVGIGFLLSESGNSNSNIEDSIGNPNLRISNSTPKRCLV